MDLMIDHQGCGATTFCLTGDVDLGTAIRLLDAIASTIAGRDDHECVIDLTGVTFMDSTGLRAMLEAKRMLDGHAMRLVTNDVVDRALALAGIADHFNAAGLPTADLTVIARHAIAHQPTVSDHRWE